MITECPVCQRPVAQDRFAAGFVYCAEGHLTTYAPFDQIDAPWLNELRAILPELRAAQRLADGGTR